MLRPLLIVAVLVTSLTACDKISGKGEKKDAAAAPVKLVIAPEDFITIRTNALASGPVVSGSIQPERKADLRAEVSAVVLQVLKENGDVVRKGDVLVRLDTSLIVRVKVRRKPPKDEAGKDDYTFYNYPYNRYYLIGQDGITRSL